MFLWLLLTERKKKNIENILNTSEASMLPISHVSFFCPHSENTSADGIAYR